MRTESGNKLSYFPHLGLSGRQQTGPKFNKIVPNLVLTSLRNSCTNKPRKVFQENQVEKDFNWIQSSILSLDHSSSFALIIFVVATERIFKESVNFQRITNSKRILDSWFRNVLNESFLEKCNWNWENVTPEAFLQSWGWQSDEKEGGLLGTAKLFTCESNDWIVEARMYIWALQLHQPYCSS